MTESILFVDDEINILESLKRNLRRSFVIDTALGGAAGLEAVRRRGPFAVVVSDMRMPGMDGTAFLSQVRTLSPDTVRLLLTGQADLRDAIAVVNEGQIFRFLTKPCAPETLTLALHDALKQYRLQRAERELLDNTLKGSIKLLVDILSLANPNLFSRAMRIRKLAAEVGKRLGLTNLWEVEMAAMFSQIGCVSLPNELLERKFSGTPLSGEDAELFSRHPQHGRELLCNIPRLEAVAEAVAFQNKHFDGSGLPVNALSGESLPISARILKALLDFDQLAQEGRDERDALREMSQRNGWYDPQVLAALTAVIAHAESGYVIKHISAVEITQGMIPAEGIYHRNGALLVPARQEISKVIELKLQNYARAQQVREPIAILLRLTADKSKHPRETLESEHEHKHLVRAE